ncbi:MAG TPA: hypothetical protein PLS49_00920, partial [Candidatus Woesebacteria bacterium]|nr:hypothetical protein [Candidatus Woesebacteria bacterium]
NSLTTHDEYTFSTLGIGLPGIDAAESTVTVTSTGGQNFVSPLVKKDSQYTFYLSDYPFGSNYYTGSDLYIYFGGSSSGCGTAGNNGADRTLPAIEITTLTNTNTVSRTIVEPCTSFTHRIQNTTITGTSVTAPQQIFSGYTFRQRYLYTLPANTRLLVVRPIFGETYVGFYTNNPNISFPIQGKTITSTAISTTGISKTVTLFRSNPQLPADFFVTSF